MSGLLRRAGMLAVSWTKAVSEKWRKARKFNSAKEMGKQMLQPVDAYLDSVQPGYALLIEGNWGAGKSYFWNVYAGRLKKLTPITISAAGLQSYEDLERALFQASIVGIGPPAIVEAGAVIGRALLRLVKVEPNDIKLRAAATGGKSVVCIDDVERFAGDFQVLFGFIVNLIDATGMHVVLIADEKRAVKKFPDYAKFKERIVGKTVLVAPTIRSFCEDTIRGFATKQTQDVLLGGIDDIVSMVELAQVKNLRTVKFYLTELDGVVRNLKSEHAAAFMGSELPSALLFWACSTSKKVGNVRLVAKAFAQEDLGMALAFHKQAKREDKTKEKSDISRLADLLDQMGLADRAYSWPRSQALIRMINGEEIDYAAIADDFQLGSNTKPAADAMTILKNHHDFTDHELQGAIETGRQAIHEQRPIALDLIFGIYHLIYYYARIGVSEQTPEECTDEVANVLNTLRGKPESVSSSNFEPWPFEYDDNEKRIIALCREVREIVQEHETAKERGEELRILVEGGDARPGRSGPIFVDAIDAEKLLADIREAGLPAVLRFQRLLRSRNNISNAVDYYAEDRTFSSTLASLIETKIKLARPMKIVDAELLILARMLRQFSERMERELAEKEQRAAPAAAMEGVD